MVRTKLKQCRTRPVHADPHSRKLCTEEMQTRIGEPVERMSRRRREDLSHTSAARSRGIGGEKNREQEPRRRGRNWTLVRAPSGDEREMKTFGNATCGGESAPITKRIIKSASDSGDGDEKNRCRVPRTKRMRRNFLSLIRNQKT